MSYMIVCPEPHAAQAGVDAIHKGGNVVDAAISGAFTQGVVNPKACGIGGHAQIFIWLRSMKEPKWINFGPRSGSLAHESLFEYTMVDDAPRVKNRENSLGYKSIMIPSFIREAYTAHSKYGKLPWAEVLEPAIKWAREGVKVYPYIMNNYFWGLINTADLRTTDACARIYTKNGSPYEMGDTLIQKDYASTLQIVAEEGPDAFYRGEIAEKIVSDFEEHGGLLTAKDLRDCKAREDDPLVTSYKEYTVYQNVPPTTGPIKSIAFNLLENLDLKSGGWLTPEYLNQLSKAIQLASSAREKYVMADPKYNPEIWDNWEKVSSKEYAKELVKTLLKHKDNPLGPSDLPPIEPHGTTHLAVSDDEGNMVNLKHTVCSSSGVVTEGLGFMYNNQVSAFDPRPGRLNSVGPDKTNPIGGSPTTLALDGEPVFISGSPVGARGGTAEIQAIIGMIEFGMTPQQAVSVPRIHADRHWGRVYVEPNFPSPYPLSSLREMGNTVVTNPVTGVLSVIRRDPVTGKLEGGADPRGAGGLGKISLKR